MTIKYVSICFVDLDYYLVYRCNIYGFICINGYISHISIFVMDMNIYYHLGMYILFIVLFLYLFVLFFIVFFGFLVFWFFCWWFLLL